MRFKSAFSVISWLNDVSTALKRDSRAQIFASKVSFVRGSAGELGFAVDNLELLVVIGVTDCDVLGAIETRLVKDVRATVEVEIEIRSGAAVIFLLIIRFVDVLLAVELILVLFRRL